MAEFPAMPLYTDAYLGDTTHLTATEHGVYLLLLMTMWRNGGWLPNDEKKLAKFARVTTSQWRRMADTILDFFTVEDERISQTRLTETLGAVRRKVQSQSDRAKAKPRKNKETPTATAEPRLANQNQSICVSSETHMAEPEEVKTEEPEVAQSVTVGQRVAKIFGLENDPNWLGSYVVAGAWLAAGYDPELDIYPAAREVAERLRKQRKPMPGSLNYLTKVLNGRAKSLRADAALVEGMPKSELVFVKRGSPQFKAWLAHYRANGQSVSFMEKQDQWTVPTEWPPQEAAA